jgi:hypothetical protein
VTHLRRSDYEVRPISRSEALDLVKRYHYAGGGANTAVYTHGLFRVGCNEPLGAAWWLPPTKNAAAATVPLGYDWRRTLALSRLVVHPDIPTNGASFLLGGSERLIRAAREWTCLVTYADTWRGHEGAIYRATNWEYMGLTTPEAVWVDENNRMVARKRGPRTLTNAEMLERGYRCLGRFPKHKFRKVLTDTPK